jgi:hypothetical protein
MNPMESRPSTSIGRSLWGWLWGERHALMVALVIGVAVGVYWNRTHPPMHHSTIELYLSEPFRTSEEAEAMTLKPTNGLVRLYHDATSDAILQRISQSHDMPSRYGIHADVPERARIAVQMLRSRITASTTQFESLRLTVHDPDRHAACSLARLIHLELKAELEQRAIQQVRRTAAIFEQLGSAWAVEADRERSALATLLEANGPLAKGPDADREMIRLNLAASQAQTATSEQARMRSNLWRMQALVTNNQVPELMLVQEATLDDGPSLREVAFRRMAFVLLACLCIMLAVRALIRIHRADIVGLIDMLSTEPGQPPNGRSNGLGVTHDDRKDKRRLVEADQSL